MLIRERDPHQNINILECIQAKTSTQEPFVSMDFDDLMIAGAMEARSGKHHATALYRWQRPPLRTGHLRKPIGSDACDRSPPHWKTDHDSAFCPSAFSTASNITSIANGLRR